MTGADEVVVRDGTEADLPALTEIYNHYIRHTAITFDIEPFTVEQRREWLGHYAPTGPHRLLVAAGDDTVLGYATSSPFRPKAAYSVSVETSVYLRPDATGRGLGSRLYGALFDELAGADLRGAFAGIALPNDASLRLHKKLGFQEIGVYQEVGRKHDRYWDVLWLRRRLP